MLPLADATLDSVRWIHIVFNVMEAIVWWAAAVVVTLRMRRLSGTSRKVAGVAGVALVLFGISDVWEVVSGTWFRPPGLLALNVSCVAVLLPCLVYSWRLRRRLPGERGAPESGSDVRQIPPRGS